MSRTPWLGIQDEDTVKAVPADVPEEARAEGTAPNLVPAGLGDDGDWGEGATQRDLSYRLGRTTWKEFPAIDSGEWGASATASVRVLVVDTDRDLLRALRAAGRQQLLEVVGASNVGEALAHARTGRIDVAVVDIDPGAIEETLQVIALLRGVPGCSGLPFAVMSSDPQLSCRVAAAHAGASLFLVKPLDPDAFTAAAHQLAAIAHADRPRILLVDDDVEFCRDVAAILEANGMAVAALHDPAGILAELDRARPDLLLLDHGMPGVSGRDLCASLRAMPRWQDLPILFLTGEGDLASRVAAFGAGADDYLVKPVLSEELLARIQVRVERARLLHERADKDMLTGLPLRRPFMESLAARLAEGQRHQRPLTVGLIDLDHFKDINEAHGHLAGDRALASFGQLLLGRFRREDLRARWGGEEFALAFPGEVVPTVHGVLGKVLAELAAIVFQGDDGRPFRVSFSAGISTFPEDGLSAHALLSAADRRLRRAKLAGRAVILCVG